MKSKAGFTLLEAMVALVIASISLTAIFSMQYELIDAQKRHEKSLEKAVVRRDALAMIKDINFDVTPESDVDLPPNRTLHWTSTALNDPKLSAGFPTGDGVYYVTLYTVTAEVDDADGATIDTFDVERMGWTSTAQSAAGLTGVAAATPPVNVAPAATAPGR